MVYKSFPLRWSLICALHEIRTPHFILPVVYERSSNGHILSLALVFQHDGNLVRVIPYQSRARTLPLTDLSRNIVLSTQ